MPSRPAVAAILVFWLTTTGFAVYRDVWPRLRPTGPPPVSVDLQDEATQFAEVQWTVTRNGQRIGRLTTSVKHIDADDTILFTQTYTNLELEVRGVRFQASRLRTTLRVTRAGELREQTMDGDLKAALAGTELAGTIGVKGRVEHDQFVGTCDIRSPVFTLSRPLDPVPVPAGQVLNPLVVANRMTGLHPGRRWEVKEVNPLMDAGRLLVNEKFGPLAARLMEPPATITAEVLPESQPLPWKNETADCWVVEYRGGEATARTWVRRADGKVLKQEAFGMGERLTVEREE